MNTPLQRLHMLVGGQVQGVGFRPFVYRCAIAQGLTGQVGNTAAGVEIQVQGTVEALAAFRHDFHHHLPPLARLTSCEEKSLPVLQNETAFTIVLSGAGGGGHTVLVSPDVTLCPDCQADMADPHNRRYGYPFTNCTNCGPRYTITHSIPYDRATTSMACFPLCPDCAAEYANPLDRRFHAQPNACPVCGPRMLVVKTGESQTMAPAALHETAPDTQRPLAFHDGTRACGDAAALHEIAVALHAGRIAVIKGLGGFQLACNAFDPDALALLRKRKNRPHKALALMVPNIATARLLAHCSPQQEALLASAEAPIVVCRKRLADTKSCPSLLPMLPTGIAPDGHSVGLMLPYTPLHHMLLQTYASLAGSQPVALVMTSGNAGGEPICLGNREALQRLQGMADIFLLHNRDILVRADDSVVAYSEHDAKPIMYRRARGYVPRPIALATDGPCVLGMGAELKATLCLTRGKAAFVSQHIGDLHNVETFDFYLEVARHLEMLLEVQPAALVCDLHPDYMSSQQAHGWAQDKGLPLFFLQHHAAHAWSVLTEQGHCGPALVWALDGTGLGVARTVEENGEVGTGLGIARNVEENGEVGTGLGIARNVEENGEVGTGLGIARNVEGNGELGTGLGIARDGEENREISAIDSSFGPSSVGIENDPRLGGPWHASQDQVSTHSPALWGGELLFINTQTACQRRLGRLLPFPLPGGDAAVREPWRVAQGLLTLLHLPWTWPAPQQEHAPFISAMVHKNVQCPPSSSLGRLFDAVAALLGLCLVTTYEGQAALRLQEAQYGAPADLAPYAVPILPPAGYAPQPNTTVHVTGQTEAHLGMPSVIYTKAHPELWQWDTHSLFTQIHADMLAQVPVPHIARKFHCTLAQGLADVAAQVAHYYGLQHMSPHAGLPAGPYVALTGGVLQNPSLAYLLPRALQQHGLTALMHSELPPNDGSIALGQAAYGRAMLARKGQSPKAEK